MFIWHYLRAPLFGATLAASALLATGPARAAMNFCAAPGLQSNESTLDAPAVQALTRDAATHLGDTPRVRAHLHSQLAGDADDLAFDDLTLLRDAALAWRVTNDARYLDFVKRYLNAWTGTYQPDFDPADESRFAGLILAYDMTASVLPIDTRNGAAAFIQKLGNGYAQQAQAARGPAFDATQNQRLALVALAGFTLSDGKLMATSRTLYQKQIAQLRAAAAPAHALEPLVTTALAARRFNRALLVQRAPDGTTLASALDRAAATATADDATAYYLAARLDGRYTRIARKLAPHAPGWIAACLPLPAAASVTPIH